MNLNTRPLRPPILRAPNTRRHDDTLGHGALTRARCALLLLLLLFLLLLLLLLLLSANYGVGVVGGLLDDEFSVAYMLVVIVVVAAC